MMLTNKNISIREDQNLLIVHDDPSIKIAFSAKQTNVMIDE